MRYEFINSPGVESIDLTGVDIVDGDLVIVGNPELATLNLQSLQTTQYDFVVAGNPELTVLGTTLDAIVDVDIRSLPTDNEELPICQEFAEENDRCACRDGAGGLVQWGQFCPDSVPEPEPEQKKSSASPTLRRLQDPLGKCVCLRNQPTPECTSATLTNIGGPDELCRPDENGAITLGIEIVNNDLVEIIRLDDIIEVGGSIIIEDCPALTTMELNALQHIGGALKVRNTGVRSLNIAAVQTIGEVNDESLVITENADLTTLDATQLTNASGRVLVTDNAVLNIATTQLASTYNIDLEAGFSPAPAPPPPAFGPMSWLKSWLMSWLKPKGGK
jgi:hypothetical protein